VGATKCFVSLRFVLPPWPDFFKNSTRMKTTTFPLTHSRKGISCPLALLLIPFALAYFALSPLVRAVDPPREGGYSNQNTAESDNAPSRMTGRLNTGRYNHTAMLLQNGMVLVAAGEDPREGEIASAELYDPASGIWTPTGSLNDARWLHTATLLHNDMVLVAAGDEEFNVTASVELYDPASGTWTDTGRLNTARRSHTATLLQDGRVLVAGGLGNNSKRALKSAELGRGRR
jgi:hypothetical protein